VRSLLVFSFLIRFFFEGYIEILISSLLEINFVSFINKINMIIINDVRRLSIKVFFDYNMYNNKLICFSIQDTSLFHSFKYSFLIKNKEIALFYNI
jgi:hypothetical protein